MLNLMDPLIVLTLLALATSVVSAADPKPESEFTTTDPKKVKILEDSSREKDPEIDHFRHLHTNCHISIQTATYKLPGIQTPGIQTPGIQTVLC
jgi:hypothetical protein